MDARGQMLLLSALAVCVCLIMLATFLTSINYVEAAEKPWAEKDALDNLIWAQDAGFEHLADGTGNYSWASRWQLAQDFKAQADGMLQGISMNMLTHGLAFSFTYNDTLASGYLDENPVDRESIGGILVKKEGVIARVYGCAWDLSLADGSAQYSVSKVIAWD